MLNALGAFSRLIRISVGTIGVPGYNAASNIALTRLSSLTAPDTADNYVRNVVMPRSDSRCSIAFAGPRRTLERTFEYSTIRPTMA